MSGLLDSILERRNQLIAKHYANAYPSTASSIGNLNKWIGKHHHASDYSSRWNNVVDPYMVKWNSVKEELPTAPLNALPLWDNN